MTTDPGILLLVFGVVASLMAAEWQVRQAEARWRREQQVRRQERARRRFVPEGAPRP